VLPLGWTHAMETVWQNGQLIRDWTFTEVRAHSNVK
jgi:nicotinamide phosphoribosyltransferase